LFSCLHRANIAPVTDATDHPLYDDLVRFKPEGLSLNGWAVKAGVNRTVWSDIRRHGNPSRRTLDRLLAAAGSSLAEFEALRVGGYSTPSTDGSGLADARGPAWRSAPMPRVPLLATVLDGEWAGSEAPVEQVSIDPANPVGQLERHPALAGDDRAYALTIVGGAMWPRFRPGRRILVSPRATVSVGDDVVVQLKASGGGPVPALVKELVRRTSGHVELRQFSPDTIAQVPADQVAAVHKIIGEDF
jgi:hypothetical protein